MPTLLPREIHRTKSILQVMMLGFSMTEYKNASLLETYKLSSPYVPGGSNCSRQSTMEEKILWEKLYLLWHKFRCIKKKLILRPYLLDLVKKSSTLDFIVPEVSCRNKTEWFCQTPIRHAHILSPIYLFISQHDFFMSHIASLFIFPWSTKTNSATNHCFSGLKRKSVSYVRFLWGVLPQ